MSEDTEQPGTDAAAGTPEAPTPAARRADGDADGGREQRSGTDVPGVAASDPHSRDTGGDAVHRRQPGRPRHPRRLHPGRRRIPSAECGLLVPSAPARLVGATGRDRPRTAHPGHPGGGAVPYPPSGDATYPGPDPAGAGRSTPGRLKAWLPVAVVAALIGGAIGAGVTALADNNSSGERQQRHHPREQPPRPGRPSSAAT